MFEEEIDGRIIFFVVITVVALVVGTLFEDTSFGNFLVNFSLILLLIGIIVTLLYLVIAFFIDINERKKELEEKELKITELENKLKKRK